MTASLEAKWWQRPRGSSGWTSGPAWRQRAPVVENERSTSSRSVMVVCFLVIYSFVFTERLCNLLKAQPGPGLWRLGDAILDNSEPHDSDYSEPHDSHSRQQRRGCSISQRACAALRPSRVRAAATRLRDGAERAKPRSCRLGAAATRVFEGTQYNSPGPAQLLSSHPLLCLSLTL